MFERLAELVAESRPTVFFRDDDADRDLPELRTLLDLFGTNAVPLGLAVIPGTLQEEGTRLLRSAAADQPLDLHQHGWMHLNHQPTGRKCEFGPARSYEQQYSDISHGKDRLNQAFGQLDKPMFTPPWNRCSGTTRRVLADLGFRAISTIQSDKTIGSLPGLAEVPVSIDIFEWKNGCRLKTPKELTHDFTGFLGRNLPIGVLLHHKVMSKDAWVLLERLLTALNSARAIFCRMEDLCPGPL